MDGDTNQAMSIEDIMTADDSADDGQTAAPQSETEGAAAPAGETGGNADGVQKQGGPEGSEKAENGLLTETKSDPQTGADGEKPGDGAAQKPGDTNPTLLELDFLGQKKTVTLEEARTLAQKGMNYDHVAQQRDELQNSPAMKLVRELAAKNGVTPEDYIRHARETMEQAEDKPEVAKLVAGGTDPKVAAELVRLRRENRQKAERETQAAQAQKQTETAEQAEKARRDADFKAFVTAYPDVKLLPDEVAKAVAGGESPLTAYQRWENAELRRKLSEAEQKAAAQQKNKENRKKNPGSLQTQTPAEAPDPLDAALKEYGL